MLSQTSCCVVFGPLSAENTAAKKHSTAAMMKAMVNADMNGVAIALGKNVVPSKSARVDSGSAVAIEPID